MRHHDLAIGRQFTTDDIDTVKDYVGIDFQQAAREGNLVAIRRYLRSHNFTKKLERVRAGGKNPLDTQDGEGFTAMHYAARYNHVDVMQLLVERGADINVLDSDGQTPLHHATRYAPKGTALNPTQIMYVPMRPQVQDPEEECEEEAKEKEDNIQIELPQDLESQAAPPRPHSSTEDRGLSLIRGFLKRRDTARVKTMAEEIAEDVGSPPIEFLAGHGADINKQDDYGLTALHCAADRGNYPAVIELLKLGNIMVNVKDKQGETPLHMAILYEDIAVIKRLLYNDTRPANPRLYSFTGMSPLHLACKDTGLEIVELVYSRMKELELRESLDGLIFSGTSDEGRAVKGLLGELGVASVATYPKHVPSLVKKLHKLLRQREDGAGLKEMVGRVVARAMKETDDNMLGHIDKPGHARSTCIHLACEDGRVEVVNFVVSSGADLEARTVERETPLHIAAHKGHLEVVQLLVDKGCPINVKNIHGETALHEAAKTSKCQVIDYLVEMGAALEARDRDGSTPIITAAAWGHTQAVTLLLELGADVTARDKRENSAVFAAIRENEPSVLKVLLGSGGERLIDTELDKFQNTPLHFTAKLGHLGCLVLLLDFQFEINAQNEDDKCPLHLAAEHGKLKCVRELVKRDCSTLEDKDDYGNHPLHYAALNGHVETCIFLCDEGAEVGCRNQLGWTPLDCAASRGNTKVMAALLDADAEIDPIDKAKLTPLHLAAKNGYVDAVLFLLDHEADIRLVDVNDLNALELAVMANNGDVAAAIINHVDADGRPTWPKALTNAQRNGDTPMKKLIRSMPEIAGLVLNKCTDTSSNSSEMTTDHPAYKVIFNYKYINDKELKTDLSNAADRKSITSADLESESELEAHVMESMESYHGVKPVELMIKYKRNHLLNHPVITSLVYKKWISYGKHFYYGNLAIYVAYLIFLTLYAMNQVSPYTTVRSKTNTDEIEYIKRKHCLDGPTESDTCVKATKSNAVIITGLATIVLSVVRIGIELLQLINQQHKYFQLQNIVELALFGLSIWFTSNVFYKGEVIGYVAWQVGVFCLLTAWMNFMMFLGKFPGIGIYIVMFFEVLGTFLKIGVVLILFLIAFGLSFNMIIDQYPAYESPGRSILRTFVMMTGELEFDSYMIPSQNNAALPLYYPESSVAMFVVFVVLVPIVFMNLLVGLAVDDIKEVYNQAELQRIVMKIQLIFQVENILPASYLEKKNKSKRTFFPNRKPTVLGSRQLARYIGQQALPFSGPGLTELVSRGGPDNRMLIDKAKFKKVKNQVADVHKQNKQMLILLKRLVMRSSDTDSVFSSELDNILKDVDNEDLEVHE